MCKYSHSLCKNEKKFDAFLESIGDDQLLYLIEPLDRVPEIFVEVFGCGCVPIAQTNMLNIDFNANDSRRTVYTIIACLMLAWGIQISGTFKDRTAKVIYCVTIFVVNIVVMNYICRIYMWG